MHKDFHSQYLEYSNAAQPHSRTAAQPHSRTASHSLAGKLSLASLFALLISGVLGGCASITTDSTQLIRVDALDEQGVSVEDATCVLKNNKGTFKASAGSHVQVRKSGKPLHTTCSAQTRDDAAEGTAISRAGAGMYGNLIFGGGVGAIIDHKRGTAYNYPEWMQVVFGRFLTFDRRDHETGTFTPGKPGREK